MVLKKPKANPQCWNIKNFKHRSQKGDVLSKMDQMSWLMQEPNEKLLSCVINLWEVIYTHFYNRDSPLDFVSVVYDSIELIIEASLWSKDYFTSDTHTQHTRLWFNQCLSHLCDCICSNVMCMLMNFVDQTQKDFWVFYLFLKVFLYSLAFCVFFIKKTGSGVVSREARD